MNPSALRTIKVMRRARIRRWKSRLRRSAMVRWAIRAHLAVAVYLCGYFTPRPMRLPNVGDPVIVYTKTRVHVGWLDENGTFRSVDNGLPLNQVTSWTRP